MKRDTPRIGVEILIVGLVLGLLVGALGLIVEAHRRSLNPPKPVPVAIIPPEPAPVEPVEPVAVEEPPPPSAPAPVDLTPGKLKEISNVIANQKSLAEKIDAKSAEIEKAIANALADAERWKTRAALIRSEVAAHEAEAARVENEAEDLAIERDALIEKRNEVKEKLNREALRARDGVAVMPYKGPNGTWRRPIAIECRADSVILQPSGITYSLHDLTTVLNPRRSPLVMDVAKAMLRARSAVTPDGRASVPYLMFVVRPDGVRPYYAARTMLEPLGITYGYELADADWQIEYPDLDDPSEWTDRPTGKREINWPPPPVALTDPPELSPSPSSGTGNGPGGGSTVLGNPWTADQLRAMAEGRSNRGASSADPSTSHPGTVAGSELGDGNGGNASSPSARDRGNPGGLGNSGQDERGRSNAPGGQSPRRSGTGGGRQGGLANLSPSGERLPSVFPSPSSPPAPNGTGEIGNGPSGWGSADRRSGSGGSRPGFDPVDLNAIGRGEGRGRPVPDDGRIPWHPGLFSELPDFEQAPSGTSGGTGDSVVANGNSEIAGSGEPNPISGTGTGTGTGTGNGSTGSGPRANKGGRGFSTLTSPPGANPGTSGAGSATESYRETIARQHGLVAPAAPSTVSSRGTGIGTAGSSTSRPPSILSGLQPPSRSGGGNATSAGSTSGSQAAASGMTGSPGSGQPAGAPSNTSGLAGLGQPGAGQPGPGGAASSGSGGAGGGSLRDPFASRALPITVSCEKSGVTIHPGNITVSIQQMISDDSMFASKVREIVQKHETDEPEMGFRPRIKFLVQPGGEVTYLKARWQANTGTNYPTTWQVVDRASPTLPDWGKP